MADVDLCKIPLSELTPAQRSQAMAQRDAAAEKIYRENRDFKPSYQPPRKQVTQYLDDVKNPIDGKVYDSKPEYYKTIRKAGCHIKEGEVKRQSADHNVAPELKQALEQHL
jgi:hypothetical protein